MKYLKLFDNKSNQYYTKISRDEYWEDIDLTTSSLLAKVYSFISSIKFKKTLLDNNLIIYVENKFNTPFIYEAAPMRTSSNKRSKVDLNTISFHLKNRIDRIDRNALCVYCTPDDYYYVRIVTYMANDIYYFKCDQIDGFMNLINNLNRYLKFKEDYPNEL